MNRKFLLKLKEYKLYIYITDLFSEYCLKKSKNSVSTNIFCFEKQSITTINRAIIFILLLFSYEFCYTSEVVAMEERRGRDQSVKTERKLEPIVKKGSEIDKLLKSGAKGPDVFFKVFPKLKDFYEEYRPTRYKDDYKDWPTPEDLKELYHIPHRVTSPYCERLTYTEFKKRNYILDEKMFKSCKGTDNEVKKIPGHLYFGITVPFSFQEKELEKISVKPRYVIPISKIKLTSHQEPASAAQGPVVHPKDPNANKQQKKSKKAKGPEGKVTGTGLVTAAGPVPAPQPEPVSHQEPAPAAQGPVVQPKDPNTNKQQKKSKKSKKPLGMLVGSNLHSTYIIPENDFSTQEKKCNLFQEPEKKEQPFTPNIPVSSELGLNLYTETGLDEEESSSEEEQDVESDDDNNSESRPYPNRSAPTLIYKPQNITSHALLFSPEGQLSSLQSMQCALLDNSEQVSSTLKTLVLKAHANKPNRHTSFDREEVLQAAPSIKTRVTSDNTKNTQTTLQVLEEIQRLMPYQMFDPWIVILQI